MNLAKLFETQKVLRERIAYNEPDRFDKLILALLVEIGECANEWRGFKFWSTNQEPRIKKYDFLSSSPEKKVYKNPLLEEYVDGLHFVLEIGLEIGYTGDSIYYEEHHQYQSDSIIDQFQEVFRYAMAFHLSDKFYALLHSYLYLGKMLGFTWEQIEQAYFEKNQINHERQNNGY